MTSDLKLLQYAQIIITTYDWNFKNFSTINARSSGLYFFMFAKQLFILYKFVFIYFHLHVQPVFYVSVLPRNKCGTLLLIAFVTNSFFFFFFFFFVSGKNIFTQFESRINNRVTSIGKYIMRNTFFKKKIHVNEWKFGKILATSF